MNKTIFAGLLAFTLTLPVAATAQDALVRFDGGIGAQPLRAGGLVNDVFGVAPAGRPWVISRLIATVVGSRITVEGRGLVLAGSNSIGTGAGQSVRARLFCGGVPSDSALVALANNGDFRIDSALSPPPPRPCATPVLLIVSNGGAWFAAGIPRDQ